MVTSHGSKSQTSIWGGPVCSGAESHSVVHAHRRLRLGICAAKKQALRTGAANQPARNHAGTFEMGKQLACRATGQFANATAVDRAGQRTEARAGPLPTVAVRLSPRA